MLALVDTHDDLARELDEAARAGDREKSVIELMNGPERPDARRRKTVLWIALAFATLMLAMTFAVIANYGLDFLTLITAIVLGFVVAAMIGALRYKGEDPMAQFDDPNREPPRPFWRRSK